MFIITKLGQRWQCVGSGGWRNVGPTRWRDVKPAAKHNVACLRRADRADYAGPTSLKRNCATGDMSPECRARAGLSSRTADWSTTTVAWSRGRRPSSCHSQ